MKGEIFLKALEIIEEFAYNAADFVTILATTRKGELMSKRNLLPRGHKTIAATVRADLKKKEEEQQERQRIHRLLYKLKKSGLIRASRPEYGSVLMLTPKGQTIKNQLQIRKIEYDKMKKYKAERSPEFIIFSFDVPEKDKRKRNWIRMVLKNLGLTMLQKSVWMGKVKIPEEFLDDLAIAKLLDYVEIFSVSNRGKINHLA